MATLRTAGEGDPLFDLGLDAPSLTGAPTNEVGPLPGLPPIAGAPDAGSTLNAPANRGGETPRERQPQMPTQGQPPLTPPSPEAQLGGGAQATETPMRPTSPTPVAGQPPMPFSPEPAPPASSLTSTLRTPSQFASNRQTALFGKQGGLLGGGLGAPGKLEGSEGANSPDLIMQLLQLLQQGQP